MAVHPGIIPGWPGYLGIPGYLDKGGYMAVHPGILGQGEVYGCPSCDNPGMARFTWESRDTWTRGYTAGHPGIIPGWPSYLGIPGYLDKGGGIRLAIVG